MRHALFLATLALGCQAEAYESIPTAKLDTFAAALRDAQVRMHARFAAARRMEHAIARGDLEAAQIDAHLLAVLDEPEALPTWRPYIDGIQDAARRVEIAGDIVAAARTTGTLGMRCARCHEAIKARVSFPVEPRPTSDPKLGPQMVGHDWAAMQMWEGLIGPSEERWRLGARALTTVPLNIIAEATTPTFDGDLDDVARVRLFATRALVTDTDEARAELFGKLLATCAHCHAILRDR